MIGEVLPLALGVAISPIPVIATILMLLAPRARAAGLAFLVGWVGGITASVLLVALLGALFISGAGEHVAGPAAGAFRLVLGALLLVLAVRTFRRRPREGEDATLPKWMTVIDTMTPAKAFGLALLLAVANPKNLIMTVSAGISVSQITAQGPWISAIVVYVLIASSTISLPILGYLILPERRVNPALESLKAWLARNNNTIMAVLLLFLAFSSSGKGIDALL